MKSAFILFLISCIILIAVSDGAGPTTKSRGRGFMIIFLCENQKGKGNCEKCGLLFYPKCSVMYGKNYRADGCSLW
jgi:hypothetical protein